MLKQMFHFGIVIAMLLFFSGTGLTQQEELGDLVKKINTKLNNGKGTREDLSEEIKGFDRLFEKYKSQKTNETAMILLMKGRLFQEVLGDEETALEAFLRLQEDFPLTDPAKEAEAFVVSLRLRVGVDFPDFQAKDSNGNPLSISQFKDKIVLVDFWASWCGPCVGEMPHVVEAYKKYHGQGFEIIGISLDNSRDDFLNFLEKYEMTWPQYFDGKGWQNELARKYSVNSIPATFLLGPKGKIIAKNLRGSALEDAVENALSRLR
jgi:thiol-disulfide isomerase/thioredoxin